MTTQSTRRFLLVCFAFLAILTLLVPPLTAQRPCCQGEEWLKLDHRAREWYVIGYVLGYSKGFKEGCEQGIQPAPRINGHDDAGDRCAEIQLDFSKGTEFLVKSVTDFYTRYPDSRDIYIYEVLNALGKNLSLEEIHKYPFTRHEPPR